MPFAVEVRNHVIMGYEVAGKREVFVNGTLMAVVRVEGGAKFRLACGELPLAAMNVVRGILNKQAIKV